MPLESPTKVFGCVHRIGGSIHRASGPDFTLTVPEGLPFGLYAVRLVADNDVDYVPFYIKAEVGNEKKICFLAPTASYMAYANDHVSLSAPLAQLFVARTPVVEQNNIVLSVHREFGLSTYDQHTTDPVSRTPLGSDRSSTCGPAFGTGSPRHCGSSTPTCIAVPPLARNNRSDASDSTDKGVSTHLAQLDSHLRPGEVTRPASAISVNLRIPARS